MSQTATILLPPKLVPVFAGDARYRGAYGGRGSGKTFSFAKMSAVVGYRRGMAGESGQIMCARQHLNSLEDSSLEEVKAAIRSEPWLDSYYDLGEKFIRSRDGRIRYTFTGLRHSLDSIKSKSGLLLCWVDEAEPVTEEAWRKLTPTVRQPGSEIWVTWNPESKRSATNERFRANPPSHSKIVRLDYRDNPWFPPELEAERLEDLAKRPHTYPHVWDGDYIHAFEGAYYALQVKAAHDEGRVTKVARDPLMKVYAFWDIGGTGRLSDATAIWVAQFVGKAVHVLAYYEAIGQPLAAHVGWLRDHDFEKAICVLPHDGATRDRVFPVSYESELQAAGFETFIVPNQGPGAAKMRIEALRRLFPSVWFNESTTEGGREALAQYHEKLDEVRGIGLGPAHDWSSHGADAGGLMAVFHSQISDSKRPLRARVRNAWAA